SRALHLSRYAREPRAPRGPLAARQHAHPDARAELRQPARPDAGGGPPACAAAALHVAFGCGAVRRGELLSPRRPAPAVRDVRLRGIRVTVCHAEGLVRSLGGAAGIDYHHALLGRGALRREAADETHAAKLLDGTAASSLGAT